MAFRQKMDHLFHLRRHHTTARREILAGVTSFSTIAYSLLLIPSVLEKGGMEIGSVMVATAIIGAFASILMGSIANYPFVLAPGAAFCVYLTYSVILGEHIPWQKALGLTFEAGLVLLILTACGVRQKIIQTIPPGLKLAVTGGLGLFLSLIGLKNAQIIVPHAETLLGFGDPHAFAFILAILGLVLIGVLMVFDVPGALFLGILFVWIFSLVVGDSKWEGFIALPPSLKPTWLQLDLDVFRWHYLGTVISLVFLAFFDSTGTLVGLAEEGKFLRKGVFPRLTKAVLPDTLGTLLAPIFGTSATAVYLESAAGIHAGGRTGVTAIIAGLFFLIALFFAPLAASIPLYATSPVLLVIGSMMVKRMSAINLQDPSEWIPAFLTLILIPLTSSVANGISIGYITYCLIKIFTKKWKEVYPFTWWLGLFFLLKLIII